MGASKTKATFRGVLVPDPRVTLANYDAADSTVTEANPKAGVPVPQEETDLVLRATGTQTAGQVIDVKALRGGFPVENGGAFVWKAGSDSSTSYRGWDVPTLPTAWESLVYTDGSGVSDGTKETHEPCAVTLDDAQVLLAYRAKRISSGATLYEIRCAKRATSGT